MNGLHDLLAKLQSIEEAAKFSDIPAVQRKKDHPHGWKSTLQDLEAEEKEGKTSHKDNLAKNNGRADEDVSDEVAEEIAPAADTQGGAGAADESMEECGDDMAAVECGDMPTHGGESKVELSMGDLIRLMNQMQKGQAPSAGHGDQPLMGDEVGEEFGNAMPGAEGPEVAPVAAVTPTGDDMHSKGAEAEKVNGGGNPLQAQLAELYSQIKEREAQLAELSKGTLASYAKKASAGASTAAFKAGMARNDSEFSKQNAKASKREAGLDKAIDKMSLKEANQMARQLRK